MSLKDLTKAYKNQERLLGKHDLNPPNNEPSPLEIDDALRNGRYNAEKEVGIKSKLQNAMDNAVLAQAAAVAAGRAADPNHQLRIDTYNALLAGPLAAWP